MGDSHRRAQPGPGPNSSPNTTRFWDKSQATYSSESWKENYRNPKEEMKKFLFGQPPDFEALAAPGALQDKRYKFAKRQGDETSSSSSDDSNEKRRRAAGRSRDVTPRASVVSLDSSAAGQPDPRPRSHLSQTHINYYHRGSEGDEHRHSSELDEGADVETRSEFSNYSNYSYEPGHDTSNSRRELHQSWGSNNQSYSSSYAASEEISISSGRHSGNSGSSQSQNRPSSGSRPSSGHISISSSRISSESGTHLSVSSLRYDGRSFDGSFQEARFPSNVGDTLDPLQRGSPALVPATAIHHDQHLQSPHPPPSDLIEQTSSNQGMLKAATEGFDSTYIFSGFKMSGNAMSPEDGEEPELDFIRKQADEGRLESQDDASSSDSDYSRSPGTLHPVRTATTSTAYHEIDSKRPVGTHSDVHPRFMEPSPRMSRTPPPLASSSLSSSALETLNASPQIQPEFSFTDALNIPSASATPKRRKSTLRGNLGALGTIKSPSNRSPSGPKSPVSPASPTRTIGPGFDGHRSSDSLLFDEAMEYIESMPSSSATKSEPAHVHGASAVSTSTPTSSTAVSPTPPFAQIVSTSQPTFIGVRSSSSIEVESASTRSSNSFPYDEPFQKTLMVWGGKEYRDLRREWVVRKERKRKDTIEENIREEGSQSMAGAGERQNAGEANAEEPVERMKDAKYRGMPVGTEELWGNFLLGRFSVTREDVVSRSAPGGKDGKEQVKEAGAGTDTDAIGKGIGTHERDASKDVGKAKATHDRNRVDAETRVEASGLRPSTKVAASDAGKPPQQRIVIRRLRDDTPNAYNSSKIASDSTSVLAKQSISIQTINEDAESLAEPPSSSQDAFASPTVSLLPPSSLPANEGVVATASSSSSSRRSPFDSHHPAILVHRHSKVAAFSISRQYSRDRGANSRISNSAPSSTPSSSQRHHVIMLAPRDVQEGTVIDRHEAVRAAFSPGGTGSTRRKEKGKSKDDKEEEQSRDDSKKEKSRMRSLSSLKGAPSNSRQVPERDRSVKAQIKSDGQIQLIRGDNEDIGILGLRGKGRKVMPDSDRVGRSADDIGTRSAPPTYYKPKKYALDGKSKSAVDQDTRLERERVKGKRVKVIDDEVSGNERSSGVRGSRENHQRAYGILDQSLESSGSVGTTATRLASSSSQTHDSISSTTSRSSNFFKRILTWDTSLSSAPSHSIQLSSKISSSTSPSTISSQTAYSASAKDITPTQSMNSDISAPYVPPWVTFATREQQEMQRHVLGQLEHSFENVGLLPSTKEKKSSGKKSALYTGGSISSRLSHKKMDVLSCVPADAYFMLLPLWPAETDTYSQRLSPFQAPSIPSDDRRYLLVFYKPLPFEGLTKGTSSLSTSDLRKILLPGFHAMARQVSHSELEGTGVRVPEQGISVNGPLEDAFKRIPRSLSHTLYSSTGDNSSVQPYIIGTSKSRDAGVEFDPEALVDLGLCTVLNEEQRRSLPPGMVVEQFDSEQATTVKLTPIGSAVMEMIWVGGLALTSFGS